MLWSYLHCRTRTLHSPVDHSRRKTISIAGMRSLYGGSRVCVRAGEGSYTTLVETPLLHGQALPEQEHMVLLGDDLESIGWR